MSQYSCLFLGLFLTAALSLSMPAAAQVSTDTQVTGKHARWLEMFRSGKRKKEKSEAQAKKAQEEARQLRDTLVTADSLSIHFPSDSLSFHGFEVDSLSLEKQDLELEEERALTESERVITDQLSQQVSGADLPPNQMAMPTSGGAPMANGSAPAIPGSAPALSAPGVSDLAGRSNPMIDKPAPRINPGAMTVTKMNGIMEDIGFDKLDAAHESMTELKEKYSTVPSVDKPEEGIKKQSLKGTPVQKRFFIGGNLGIPSTDPFRVDTDIQIGYRLNRRFELGISLIWRESFGGKKDSVSLIADQVYGYGVFSKYVFAAGFYVYGEYSSLRKGELLESKSDQESEAWQYRYLIGLGKEFRVTKFLKMSTSLLYDVNHRNNDLHPLPFIIRVGYRFNVP